MVSTFHLERQKNTILGKKESTNPILPTLLIYKYLFLKSMIPV